MNESEIKNSFRSFLPRGFVDIIRKRLQERGIERSRSSISNVCDPAKSNYDDDIITEALNLAAQTKKAKQTAQELAQSLRQ